MVSVRSGASLQARARPAEADELASIDWLHVLAPAERDRVGRALRVLDVEPGERICRHGRSPTWWFGVLDGLLKMNNDRESGHSITHMGVAPGAWFGEGTLLKREPYRYNIDALRRSRVAGLPIDEFHALLDVSLPFTRLIMNQLNERLGVFIALREIDRSDPDQRVAATLAQLVHPVVRSARGGLVKITQQELGDLAGLSRQRVNLALQNLQDKGCLRIEYGGVRVLDMAGLHA
jgi:CRP/FNR family transcriptional regulator, cyclic AMP receptor protein